MLAPQQGRHHAPQSINPLSVFAGLADEQLPATLRGWLGHVLGQPFPSLFHSPPTRDPCAERPVRGKPDLAPCCQRILRLRPDLIELILPILAERFSGLSLPQIMASLGISIDTWRHTRAFQEILQQGREEGRQEGRQEGKQEGLQEGKQEGRREGLEEGLRVGRRREACALALRQLERRCGPLSSPSRARIEALSLPQLEELALALLDFGGPDDLRDWLGTLES